MHNYGKVVLKNQVTLVLNHYITFWTGLYENSEAVFIKIYLNSIVQEYVKIFSSFFSFSFFVNFEKLKVVHFDWKLAHVILEVLILNPDLDFWNSDPKSHFWVNLGPKIQSCPFCLKIGAQSISRMLIPNPDLDFWNFDPKIHFWANLGPKSQMSVLSENWYTWNLKHADSYSNISFLDFKS